MRMRFLGSIVLAEFVSAAPSTVTEGALRMDMRSWNTAIFGPYDPDEMDSQPLQYVLLEKNDLGFVKNAFDQSVNEENALETISTRYNEPNVIYQLEMEKNGFKDNESFALLQEGSIKCKISKMRMLVPTSSGMPVTTAAPSVAEAAAPGSPKPVDLVGSSGASASPMVVNLPRLRDSALDAVRFPPSRYMQETVVGVNTSETTKAPAGGPAPVSSGPSSSSSLLLSSSSGPTSSTSAASPSPEKSQNQSAVPEGSEGGVVDIMFIAANQVKLQNLDFDEMPTLAPVNDHVFEIKGRFVHGCECSHNDLEDSTMHLGSQDFILKKLHLSCPDPTAYKELPVNAKSLDEGEIINETTSTVAFEKAAEL